MIFSPKYVFPVLIIPSFVFALAGAMFLVWQHVEKFNEPSITGAAVLFIIISVLQLLVTVVCWSKLKGQDQEFSDSEAIIDSCVGGDIEMQELNRPLGAGEGNILPRSSKEKT